MSKQASRRVGKQDESGHMAMPQRQTPGCSRACGRHPKARPGLARQKSGAVCAHLGDHGHVDGDIVALAHALALHVVCNLWGGAVGRRRGER